MCNSFIMFVLLAEQVLSIDIINYFLIKSLVILNAFVFVIIILAMVLCIVMLYTSNKFPMNIRKRMDTQSDFSSIGLDFLYDNVNFIDSSVSGYIFQRLVDDLPQHKIMRRILKRDLTINYCTKYNVYSGKITIKNTILMKGKLL